jgi:hypothetical protein
MKAIFQYRLSRAISMLKPVISIPSFFWPAIKTGVICLVGLLFTNPAGAQLKTSGKTKDSATYLSVGTSKLFVQRQGFDQWTRANFNLTEPYRPNIYVDFGRLYYRADFGLAVNVGSAFETVGGYVGGRLTGARSPIGSWLNLEMGDFLGAFTNIKPPTYNVVPAGQQLQLNYDSFYMSLVSKNYLNFLQYNPRLGRVRIPINMGFFVSAGWQPGKRNWSYGYYDQDSVFHAQRLKPIPRLGKIQATAGVFAGF